LSFNIGLTLRRKIPAVPAGLGRTLRDYHGRLFAGHTGGYIGMISAVSLLPEENLGVVVLTNGIKSPYMAVTYPTLDAFIGVN